MRKENEYGRRKRTYSPGARNPGTLERTSGAAPEAEEKGLPVAEVADHEPGPDRNYLHHGGGDLGTAGGTNLKGGGHCGSKNHGICGI